MCLIIIFIKHNKRILPSVLECILKHRNVIFQQNWRFIHIHNIDSEIQQSGDRYGGT